ncbi:MAG: Asp-tRNA(Asn)/Glu-tRNA(Gln) amidotransferase subunit GatB [Candidatus Omnitrophica bacterium]|nr:Asp-tRNA(Asn)/Glu-tRNA(Gln) amidotransferase subunit GatB [Candidatus Omnitrophota bacterium]
MELEPVIGLEVHLQLATETKLFCSCQVKFAAEANSKVCPVCLGLPGSLPVINRKAIEYAVKVALALDCTIGDQVKFDRKNYYYPDLPKNYQISQYDMPLSYEGHILINSENKDKRIRIRRVHIEEDAGKLIHEKEYSLIDYNRTGIPLLEIVTEPDISSPDEAYKYLVTLKTLLKYLAVSDCDMEKGSLRCDANISLRVKGEEVLGTKTELKNMNSFKAVKAALEVEVKRQGRLLDEGKSVIQETLLWDEEKRTTIPMRSKEEASDYRYFPEPDLVPFAIEKKSLKEIRSSLPELPREKTKRIRQAYKLSEEEAQFLVTEQDMVEFFEDCNKLFKDSKSILNWIRGPLLYEINQRNKTISELFIKPEDFIKLIKLLKTDALSNLTAKSVLTLMIDRKKGPDEVINEEDLVQVSDEASLIKLAQEVILENKESVENFLSGKVKALMFLVGQVMRKSKGKANPKKVKELLERKLKEDKKDA